MNRIDGIYIGTGSAMYIGLGFVPDEVFIRKTSGLIAMHWTRELSRIVTAGGGVTMPGDGNTNAVTTALQGIRPYKGGVMLASTNANYIGHRSLLSTTGDNPANKDQKGTVTLWTMDTAANGTGHFDGTPTTTYGGVGSKIVLRDRQGNVSTHYIVYQATNWTGTDKVTLNPDAPSVADVLYIGPVYDFYALPVPISTPAGIYVIDTTNLADATVHEIHAVQW